MSHSYTVSLRPHWFARHTPTSLVLHPTHLTLGSDKLFLNKLQISPACLPNALVLTSPRRVFTISAHPNYENDWKQVHTALTKRSGGYVPIGVLGRGAFGTVYEALEPTGRTVAVKRMEKQSIKGSLDHEAARREIEVVKRLPAHRNLVKVYHAKETRKTFLIVMERMSGTLLELVRRRRGGLEKEKALKILKDILMGLKCMHECGFVHRDVKLENVLIGPDGRAKLCDFGLAIEERKIRGEIVGTGYARAPEIDGAKGYDRGVDMWGAGILLFVMVFGRLPFAKVGEVKGGVEDWGYNEWGRIDGMMKDLLKGLLEEDPSRRLGVGDALNHPAFKDMEIGMVRRSGRRGLRLKNVAQKVVTMLRIVQSLQKDMHSMVVV